MSTRFTWLLGILVLFAIGLLVACGSHYSASSDGLVVVPSLGSAVIQSFSFNLSNGRVSAINNPPGTPDQSLPSAIVLDPAGAFAYVIVTQNPSVPTSKTGIAAFKVNSDGTLSATGTTTAAASPVALVLDSAGKFLFVANQSTPGAVCPPLSSTATIQVFSVGSNAALTEVSGSPFPVPCAFGVSQATPSALAVTPTVFPSQHATCSTQVAPTTEYLYVTDSTGNEVVEYSVDTAAGSLTQVPFSLTQPGIPAGNVPSGAVVDACRRFLYVANQNSNNISAYTICPPNSSCTEGSLSPISGSPYSALNGPGPMASDPFGNFLYVVDTLSNQISGYKISQVLGTLTPLTGVPSTGARPVSIAIRSDDNWLFVANNGSANVSQFAITPATGVLTPAGAGITTDNYPSGVAVK